MTRLAFVVAAVAGCGRVGFDATGHAPPDGVATADAGRTLPPGAGIWLAMETDPAVAIIDSAGGHAVTCPTELPSLVAGKHGMGYRTTGSQLEIASTPDLDPTSGYTAAVWIDVAAYPASGSACAFGKLINTSADTFVMCIEPSGVLVFDSEDPAGTSDYLYGPTLARGAWHHLAQVWDGSTKRGYVDGVEVAARAVNIGAGTGTFNVGGDAMPPNDFVDATLDDAIYYPRALSAAEVAQLATP